MGELAVTTLSAVKELFSKMKNVYYDSTANQKLSEITALQELPVLSDGVTFKTGESSLTKVKLTTGAIWDMLSDAGDDDIQFQMPTVHSTVMSIFIGTPSAAATTTGTVRGVTYSGAGYSTEPKKVSGGFFLTSSDASEAIWLPNVVAYANIVNENNKPAYINVKCSAMNDTEGFNIYFLKKSA